MRKIYLSIGSNKGNRYSFIKEALSINGRFGIFALEVSYTKIKEANKTT